MEFSREKINNKIKQKSGGNWGHPRKFTKKHTNIPDPLNPDKPKNKRKKKKKIKTEYISPWHRCPHCNKKLTIKDKQERWSIFKEVEPTCPHCSATQDKCPCCKRESWVKDGLYKHNRKWGCGFSGYKKC